MIEKADRSISWTEGVHRRPVPVKTAQAETGLAAVAGVTLLETRKREGKDVWTPVDRGSVYFTDRKMVFSGDKDIQCRYDHLQTASRSERGLYVSG